MSPTFRQQVRLRHQSILNCLVAVFVIQVVDDEEEEEEEEEINCAR